MGEIVPAGPSAATPHRKHLLSADSLERVAHTSPDTDLTRHRGQGNGIRVHGIYFAVVSLAVLVALIVAIAATSSMM